MARLQIILSDEEKERIKQLQAENGLSSMGNVVRFLLHGKKVENREIRFNYNKRKKTTISISKESMEHVEQEIKKGNISSMSRLVDILVLEHAKNTELLDEMRLAHEQAKKLKGVLEDGI